MVAKEVMPPVFKCEDSMWQMLADGTRTFDMRRWDMADERCLRLSVFHTHDDQGILLPRRLWEVSEVSFLNKATGQVLTFKYLGLDFAAWARGWGFILLGRRLHD